MCLLQLLIINNLPCSNTQLHTYMKSQQIHIYTRKYDRVTYCYSSLTYFGHCSDHLQSGF